MISRRRLKFLIKRFFCLHVDGSFTIEMDTLNEIYPEEIRDEKINELLYYEHKY